MKVRFTAAVSWVLVSLLAGATASAQMVMRHGGGAGGDLVVLEELGIVVGASEDTGDLAVLVLLPGKKREVALEEGDLLLMVDGKRVRDVATLREIYEGASVGDTVKVGFRRGDERFLSSFEKSEAGQDGTRIVIGGGGPGADFDDVQPLHEFQAILAQKDDRVFVSMELPMGETVLEKDDEIRSLNGKSVATLQDFRAIYDALAIGDEMTLVAVRNGEEVKVTRPKSEMPPGMRIRSSR